jgi:hypothetical protein
MNKFTREDEMLGLNLYLSRGILDSQIKKFRVSDDFSVAQDVLLEPNEITPVVVKLEKKLFPDMWILFTGMMKHFELSMRSCFAQSWIHIVWNFFDYMDAEDVYNLYQHWCVDVEVSVINRWLSDVEIKQSTLFLRLYFKPSGKSITGSNLYSIIKEWKLKIEWEYGETRSLVGANMPDFDWEITAEMLNEVCDTKELSEDNVHEALTLKLKLNGNVYIPDNHKWILIESKKNLVDVLRPFDTNNPQHLNHNFNIRETYYVDFGEYFGAIIYQGYDWSGHHIISPLIDPWFKGPIRTEIVKGREWFNDFIELHIYHKDG